MTEIRTPLSRIVVVGGGIVALSAALALRRALPRCAIAVLDQPVAANAFADTAMTALPFAHEFLDRIGITEDDILREAGGSHRLVTRYFGWGAPDSSSAPSHGVLAYGEERDPNLRSAFAREWGGGARSTTKSGTPGISSLAQALADAGRYAVPPHDVETPLAQVQSALRWEPGALHALLVKRAQAQRIAHVQGTIEGAAPDAEGGIAALALDGERRIEAELFVDCTGPVALLARALPASGECDWSGHLPLRGLAVAPRGEPIIALEDRVTLLPEGWLGENAGRGGLETLLGLPESVPQDRIAPALGCEPAAILPHAPGRLAQAWSGNVVALGDAFARVEPLGGLPFDLAQRAIKLLVELLPGVPVIPQERAEFNRRAALMADGVLDALSYHYAAPSAGSSFPAARPTDAAAEVIDQLGRRGRLPFRDEAPLLGQETIALLVALGHRHGIAPQDLTASEADALAARSRFEQEVRGLVVSAPPYAEWLQRELSRDPDLAFG